MATREFSVIFSFEGSTYHANVAEFRTNHFHVVQKNQALISRFGNDQKFDKKENGEIEYVLSHVSGADAFQLSIAQAIKDHLEK